MRYLTKDWYIACQTDPMTPEVQKRLDEIDRAYCAAQTREALPDGLLQRFFFHDGTVREIITGTDLTLRIDSPYSEYHTVTFRNAYVKQEPPRVGAFWLLGFFIIAALILHKTKFGRYVYAIGSNEEATRLSGIKVDNWKVAVYTLSGFFIGMCALFYAAAYTTITPGTGAGQEMNGITGVIIGGTSMSGGSGTMVGTLIGVFIMSVLKTGLANCGLQAPWQTFLTGAVVIGAVLLDIARTKAANRVKKG